LVVSHRLADAGPPPRHLLCLKRLADTLVKLNNAFDVQFVHLLSGTSVDVFSWPELPLLVVPPPKNARQLFITLTHIVSNGG